MANNENKTMWFSTFRFSNKSRRCLLGSGGLFVKITFKSGDLFERENLFGSGGLIDYLHK